jgi:hypothetical protein
VGKPRRDDRVMRRVLSQPRCYTGLRSLCRSWSGGLVGHGPQRNGALLGVPVSDHLTVRKRRWPCPIKSRWRLMKRGHSPGGANPARLPVPGCVSGAVRRSAAMSRQMSALALMLMLMLMLTIGLLVAPSTFHRISQDGQSTGHTHGLVGCFCDAGAPAVGGRVRPRSDAHVRTRLGTTGGCRGGRHSVCRRCRRRKVR